MDLTTNIPYINGTSVLQQYLQFSWPDYTIFVLMFVISALIGIYFGCFGSRQSTTSEYLLGSRAMSVFPVAMSLTAGHLSGITLLGIPSEIYMYGTQYWACVFTAFLVSVIIIYVYLPVFYTLKVSSSYEYLKLRFDERIRIVALVLYVIGSFLYIPIVIYIPALAFNQVTGFDIHTITPIICGLCIFYTTIGGLKAVVWTDTLQFVVTLGAMFAIFVIGTMAGGGFSEIWKVAEEGDRFEFFNMDPDPTIRTTFWGIVIGMTVSWITSLGVNPSSVQRFMSVPSLSKAKMVVVVFGVGLLFTKALSCFSGLLMYAKYKDCDPFTSKKIKRPDQILPYFVLDVARNIPGLPGLFISGVFSTALSTMSAHLNTLAGTIYEDFIMRFMPPKSTDTTANNIIKTTVVVSGTLCVVLVFAVEHLGDVLSISGCFSGVTSGPLVGIFTLGMLFPSATSKGALYGSITSLGVMAWIVGGFQYHHIRKNVTYHYKNLSIEKCLNNTISATTESPSLVVTQPFILFRVSFYWYPVIGAFVVIVVGLLVSWLCDDNDVGDKELNKDLFSPVVHRFLPRKYFGKGQYKNVEDAQLMVNSKNQYEEQPPQTYAEATKVF